jgi:mono/diheme cytochrome c family protein
MISGLLRRSAAITVAFFVVFLPDLAWSAAPGGDPISGRDLFSGARSFDGRGPQCFACHTAAGVGLLGGGALGPDLSKAFAKYGAPGLVSVLTGVPFPTMRPLYRDRAPTSAEAADLTAFLRQAGSAIPTDSIVPVVTFSLDGLAGLYILFSLLWRGRLKSARESLAPR